MRRTKQGGRQRYRVVMGFLSISAGSNPQLFHVDALTWCWAKCMPSGVKLSSENWYQKMDYCEILTPNGILCIRHL